MSYCDKSDPKKPEGYQFVEPQMQVAGVQYHRGAAQKFAGGKAKEIRLVQEPDNKYDPNAIKVVGIYQGIVSRHEEHVGYVPAELAQRLTASGVLPSVTPRWRRVYISDAGFTDISFDIIAPAEVAKRYRQVPEVPPSQYVAGKRRERQAAPAATMKSGCLCVFGLVVLLSVLGATVTGWLLRH